MNKDLILTLLQQGRANITNTYSAVPEDKLTWRPLDNGRSALDLFGEAGQTCAMIARLVESRGEDKPTRESFQAMREERANWTHEQALAAMESGADALFAVLNNVTDEELAQPVTMTIGGGMTMPLAGWAMMAYRTFISRFAQINYIQTLYGDFDSH
jgi:hypothetical protein